MKGEITFYKHPGKNYRNAYCPGQFFLAPIPYLLRGRESLLRVDFLDRENGKNNSFSLESKNISEMRPEDIPSLVELGIPREEFVPFLRFKFRPVILLTNVIPNWCMNKPHDEDCFIVAPLYSVMNDDGTYKFTQRFIMQVQAYMYPSLFYLPEDRAAGAEESIVRFDRIAIAKMENLRPIPLSLTEDGLYCLTRWLGVLLGEPTDEIIGEYRQAALSAIDNLGK